MAATPALRVTLQVTVDDGKATSFPAMRRLAATDASQFSHVQAAGAGYTALPTELGSHTAVLLIVDQPVRVALNGQTANGTNDVPLDVNGVLLVYNGLASVTVENNLSGNPATLRGIGLA